jgi:hypothetical protein
MPRVGFKPTTLVFQRSKAVHALDCEDIVIGYCKEKVEKLFGRNNVNNAITI